MSETNNYYHFASSTKVGQTINCAGVSCALSLVNVLCGAEVKVT